VSGRAFRGAGQTADLEILPGTEQQSYLFTLTEPYLLETNYAASGTVLYQTRNYSQYDETRYGGNVSLGRRFGSVWTGNLVLRNEWVKLTNIPSDSPVDYFEAANLSRLSGLGLQMTRNTTDSHLRPSRGTLTTLGAEQLGVLGGDFDFTKLHFDWTGFYNVYESFLGYKTVLKLENRMALIPQGQDSAPVYERYFLGGQSFRGFNYRAISPVGKRADGTQTNDVVGGSWEFFAGAELNQPVYQDIVSLVTFVDSGTVQEQFGFDQYRVSVGVGVRILIKQLSPVPLAFDFGFPVMKQNTDRERVFTFSVDIPY
jgi:outer membrane protein insertion porin family